MKINLVKDPTGKVIATFEAATAHGATLTPVLPHGHKVEEIEVAENYREKLSEVYSHKKP